MIHNCFLHAKHERQAYNVVLLHAFVPAQVVAPGSRRLYPALDNESLPSHRCTNEVTRPVFDCFDPKNTLAVQTRKLTQ